MLLVTLGIKARGNLTQLTDAAVPSNSRANSYDGLSRLVSASGPWGSGSYTYDALGNLRQKQLGPRTVGLSYNSVNRLVTSDDSGSSGLRSFSYDSRGNVTAAGALQFSYDAENQPISVSGSSSGNYVYDGNLKRVKQTVNGATIYNVYDKAGQLVHVDKRDAGKSTDYIHGAQGTLARITNTAVTYLHHDSLGSAQSGTDSSGAILWQEAYTPYGETLNDVSANQDLAGFTGHIKDDATGLSYMQARYYDPVIGRFYSNDPVDMLGHLQRGNSPANGFNRYSYANNNPYKYVDPDGEFGIIGALIGGGIDAAIQIGNNMKNGQGFGEAVMNVDLGSVAVSAALGSVTGGATTLLKGAATGTTKVAGATVQLTTKTERAVAGALGANKAAAAGFVQAERKAKDGVQGAAAQVVNGVTSPVPVGTLVMEGAAMLTGADEKQTPPEVEREQQ